MNSYLLVGAGGAIGAMLRYGFSTLVGRAWTGPFPLGTFGVNVIGSLLMGLLVGVLARTMPDWQNEARLFVAVGVLGGFTTFSSFSLDAITLIERGQIGVAFFYAVMSVIVAVGALYVGLLMVRAVPV